jgi:RimJ/RimL family protein N-acetyltransferase
MFVLETERLILRPLQMSDVDDLFEYQSQPEIVAYIPWPERTREEVVEALEKALATGKDSLTDDGDFILLGWEIKDSPENRAAFTSESIGKIIGQSNIGMRSSRDQCAEIGWVTHQDFQRRGFALEATRKLMRHAFSEYSLHRIVADIDTRNPESSLLAEKLGMRREAEYKDGEFFKGAWCDMWLYAILEDEFIR